MKMFTWLVAIALAAGFVYAIHRARLRAQERREASEARAASLIASMQPAGAKAAATPQAAPAGKPAPAIPMLAQQKLLLDAAAKAAEANEPALSIQLYARLLSRYPDTQHAAQARAAVEVQKKKLAKH